MFIQKRPSITSAYQKILPLGIIILVAFACLILFNNTSTQITLSPPVVPTSIPTPTPTPHYTNIALLGYGGGGHEGGALTDSLLVARIDDKARKIFLISIPRDTSVDLPVRADGEIYTDKINAAYVWGLDDTRFPNKPEEFRKANSGGGNLAKYALEQVMGERVSNYASVSFQVFTDFIDELGGIEITRRTSFSDPWYPLEEKRTDPCGKSDEEILQVEATLSGYLREREFPCRFETITFPAGTQTFDGITALKYVRSRHSATEGSDFYRSERQRQVILAVKEKMLNVFSVPQIISFATKFQKYIDTDFTLANIPSLVNLYLSKKDYQIQSVALTNSNVFREAIGGQGQYLLVPRTGAGRYTDIHAYLQDIYTGMSEASAAARFQPTKTPVPSKALTPTRVP